MRKTKEETELFVLFLWAFLLNLPVLLPIAWNHIQLCQQQETTITPQQIVRHIGAAGRNPRTAMEAASPAAADRRGAARSQNRPAEKRLVVK